MRRVGSVAAGGEAAADLAIDLRRSVCRGGVRAGVAGVVAEANFSFLNNTGWLYIGSPLTA